MLRKVGAPMNRMLARVRMERSIDKGNRKQTADGHVNDTGKGETVW